MLYLIKIKVMKKILFLFAIISFVSCNDMESDIDKACELTTELMTETIEKMPEAIELGMKAKKWEI